MIRHIFLKGNTSSLPRKMMRGSSEEDDDVWPVPKAIGEVVKKLRNYLENDSDSFKGTMKMLGKLEEQIPLLSMGNLNNVKPDKEEARAAWLTQIKAATEEAQELVCDMDNQLTSPLSDGHSRIRMKYTIGKLLSICAKGESIIDMPNLYKDLSECEKEHTSESHDSIKAKYLLDDGFLIGRNAEIAMLRDMVLDNAQYVATATTLEIRIKEAEKLHIPLNDWITETLRKIDLSKRTDQATEVSPYPKDEFDNRVEYMGVTYLRNPAVIPIVGISGVGKSALAKFIFNDVNVQERFGDGSTWVYMTDKTDQLEMIKKIICSFDPDYGLNYAIDLESARIKLQNIIEGKRFLLVLDDVWDEINVIWNDVRSVLNKGAPGSVVLVTTQSYSVANFVGTSGPVILDPLQTDDSWELLKRYALVEPCRSLSTEGFEEIGRKMAQRLPGLPLAVKVTGATLGAKLEEAHWRKLLNSWWWNISDDNFAIRVISSLGSCYSELPGYLRQCFVYCSIFPRNYVFEKDKLAQMWIANGFVQHNNSIGVSMLEDIAGEWFDEIVNRGFLQPACKVGYVMHDMVWQFASALSSNECHGINNKLRGVSQDVRYLSIHMEDLNALPENFNVKQLRTIMLIGDIYHPSSNETYLPLGRIFDGSIGLRLLAFSSRSLGAEIRNDMSALKYLRYLDLSFTGIKILPDSVCSLCHLQVLGLRGCTFDYLPIGMNSLISLRHLHASSNTVAQITGIGKLTKLQELHEYHVKAEVGHRITELSDINDLRGSLCISELEWVTNPAEALEANIVEKNNITALELKWSNTLTEERTPDLLKAILGCLSPPRHLQELKLYGYSGFAFPDWVGQLKHVRVVEISSCENLNVLPPLGQLEHLQKLMLHWLPSIKDIGSEFYGSSDVVFRSLEELSFEDMRHWESWTYAGSSDFIPNLQKLQIRSCDELSKVPFESLGSATKEIILKDCGLFDDTVSCYLRRQNSLTCLDVRRGWSCKSGKLILPCKQLMSLEYLYIEYFQDVCIIGGLWYMRNLKDLRIIKCPTGVTVLNEESTREAKGPTQIDRVMHSLTHLVLEGDRMHIDLENIIPQTPSLQNLHLNILKGREKWLQHLTSLQELKLSWSDTFPSNLASLSSLKRIALEYCYGIRSIPPDSLPGNLKELHIKSCSDKLEARCQNPAGDSCICYLEKWQERKMGEWQVMKIQHGQRKLTEMHAKEETESLQSFKWESLEKSAKYLWPDQRMKRGHGWPRKQPMNLLSVDEQPKEEEQLEEWLQPSEGDKGLEHGRKGLNKEALHRNKDDPSSLMKTREEWLKEQGLKFRAKTLGKDWPNIRHVPYIRVNRKIVQNLYV